MSGCFSGILVVRVGVFQRGKLPPDHGRLWINSPAELSQAVPGAVFSGSAPPKALGPCDVSEPSGRVRVFAQGNVLQVDAMLGLCFAMEGLRAISRP